MASKRFALLVTLRIVLMAISIFLICWLWLFYDLVFVPILLISLISAQVWELIWFVNRTNRDLRKFLEALRYGDYSVNFSNPKLGSSFHELGQSFNEVSDLLRDARAEKQTQYELVKLALENISLGMIILDRHQAIVLMNQAAQDILDIPMYQKWDMLARKNAQFVNQLGNLESDGRRLIELDVAGEQKECYLDLTRIDLQGQEFKLISFTDLKKEIEQKEIDAWHKLIRILAHEVMNSVTPVTSLSETIRDMLTDDRGHAIKTEELDEQKVDDIILALDTIIRRSKGMLNFVDDYRKLTRLPAPRFEVIGVKALLEDVTNLMKTQAEAGNISMKVKMPNNRIAVRADRKLIEQNLINLISNAIHALKDTENAEIVLSARITEANLVISVADNGPGIPEDILSSIFIPFFSTRKDGTGIGLTLSKNIMRLHRGSINVSSRPGDGCLFELMFNI
jgi:two-component system nitrogen regulation sensor histidine kinase NtrY